MKIIVVIDKYGGFCNRLFQSIHFHAYSIEKKIKFFNPTMIGLLKFDNKIFYFFDKVNNFILKIFMKFFQIISQGDEICFFLNKNNYIKFVYGWDFREYKLLDKYYKDLSNIYSFDEKYLSKKSKYFINYIRDLKLKGKYIVGIHIRRKDYKSWNDGRYYFMDHFYNKISIQIKEKLIRENYDPFIIALSDDDIAKLNIYDYLSDGSWKEDQIILQNCNLIIGPPSTFTMWASYIAQVPLIKLDSERNYDLNNRQICSG